MKFIQPIVPFHILIIEDDPDTRANLCDLLELEQHRVHAVGTISEGIEYEDLKNVSVIIVDRKLPDGMVDEYLPKFKQDAPNAAIIIVTGYADLDSVIKAIFSGATDYLIKPINVNALLLSLRRIAEHKLAEEQRLQSERLSAIGNAVAGLAHEGRNFLQSISSGISLLRMSVPEDPKLDFVFDSLDTAQNGLLTLFNDVREFAAPLKLELETCNLRDIWEGVWQNLISHHPTRQASLSHQIGKNIDLNLRADPFRLKQVFHNLFDNSLVACLDPAHIEVVCQESKLQNRPAIQIAVIDNGSGLSSEQRKRIFDNFFTTKKTGTGLGMSIVYRIVKAHKGEISAVDHQPGAKIVFTLPRNL